MRNLLNIAHASGRMSVYLLCLLSFPVLAQESILPANDNAAGNGGTVSYSVGQVVFMTTAATTGILTEGVQQPYEILFMTGLEDKKAISLDCIVYPNPASTEVRLKIDRPLTEKLSYQLENSNGLIISSMKIESKETVIPLTKWPAGIYLLTVMENDMSLATWKVIKK